MTNSDTNNGDMKRSVVFVLGMHRSGTSALSKMLSLLGCDLPKSLMPGTSANAGGYWESMEVMALNDAILSSGGSQWNDWLPFSDGWYKSPVFPAFVERGVAVIDAEFGSSSFFVLKDPRCARLVPFWKAVFERRNLRPLVIIPLRNPLEVASSLVERDHINHDIASLLWLRHVLDAECDTRGISRAFSTYQQLLDNWSQVAKSLQESLGISWPGMTALSGAKIQDYIDAGSRHYQLSSRKFLSDTMIASWLRDVYAIMLRWASTGEESGDYDRLDAIRSELNAAGPAFIGITQSLIEQDAHVSEMRSRLEQQAVEVSQLTQALNASRHDLAIAQDALFERNGIEAQGASSQEALRHAHDAASQRVVELEAQLAQVQQLVSEGEAQAAIRMQELHDRLAQAEALLHEREAATDGVLSERNAEAQALRDQIQALAEEAEAQTADQVRQTADRLSQLESTLRQREEEIEQTIVQRDAAMDSARGLEVENARIDGLRKDADQWVFRLADERQKADRLASQFEAEAATARLGLQRAQRELQVLQERLNGLPRNRDVRSMLDENAALKQAAVESARHIENLEKIRIDLESALDASRGEVVVERSSHAAASLRAAEMVAEIAALSSMLGETEGETHRLAAALSASHDAVREQLEEAERWKAIAGNTSLSPAPMDDVEDKIGHLTELLLQTERTADARLNEIEHWKAVASEASSSNLALTTEHHSEVGYLIKTLAEMQKSADNQLVEIDYWKNIANKASLSNSSENENALASIARKSEELATLSSLLKRQQSELELKADQARWLRQVIPVITRVRWWSNVVSEKYKMKRNHGVLLRRGLFDADAYVARYPDVIEEGIDPVKHYILHGMEEGRSPLG